MFSVFFKVTVLFTSKSIKSNKCIKAGQLYYNKYYLNYYTEWIEFSPFEIGMAKYGTFVRTSDFNSKYFMGVISTHYKEAPLHFLMVRINYS